MLRTHPGAARGMLGALLTGFVILMFYAWDYLALPFSTFWNNFIQNALTVIPALLCGWTSTLVYGSYQPNDAPRRVWLHFALAFWCWTLGELAWAIYSMLMSEVPVVSIADVFWLLGNIFFTLAFLRQYSLLNRQIGTQKGFIAAGLWLLGIVLSLALMYVSGAAHTLGTFLEFFYFVSDLILGIVAIVIVARFGSAALARPWVGFFVIALSDILYAYLYELGGFAGSVEKGNLLGLVQDLIYIFAYLIMAFGIVNQYLLLKYGAGSMYISEMAE